MTRDLAIITTPDPRFDPHGPIVVNGYRFVPGARPYVPGDPRGAEALQIEDVSEICVECASDLARAWAWALLCVTFGFIAGMAAVWSVAP